MNYSGKNRPEFIILNCATEALYYSYCEAFPGERLGKIQARGSIIFNPFVAQFSDIRNKTNIIFPL